MLTLFIYHKNDTMFFVSKQVYAMKGQIMVIGILGYGVVGKGVYKLALKNNIKVKYILVRKGSSGIETDDINKIVSDEEIDTIVECLGGDDVAFSYCKQAIMNGKNIVTSNKKMLVKYLKEINDLAFKYHVSLLYSSSCGGGVPVLHEINRIASVDKIVSLSGIMNGTCNYILDQMNTNDLGFQEALKQAQDLGYAEKDPSDDIKGIDSANKLILASFLSFNKAYKLGDLFVKGISNIDSCDIKYFKANGYKCILLAKANDDCLTVMPTLVKKGPFSSIVLNNNCFRIEGEDLGSIYLIGQGAGQLPTASNILRDLKDLDHSFCKQVQTFEKPNYENNKGRYYIRKNNEVSIVNCSVKELEKTLDENDFVCEVLDD